MMMGNNAIFLQRVMYMDSGKSVNYIAKAESLLANYSNLVISLSNLRSRQVQLTRQRNLPKATTVDLTRPISSSSFSANALAEFSAIAEELSVVTDLISETRAAVKAIDSVLRQLTKRESKLLRLWYIAKKSKNDIVSEMGYSEKKSIYNLRSVAINNFSVLYYGLPAVIESQGVE